jgi:hypothetical protein
MRGVDASWAMTYKRAWCCGGHVPERFAYFFILFSTVTTDLMHV